MREKCFGITLIEDDGIVRDILQRLELETEEQNHRFPRLRNRTTDNRKCEKARNIKEKRIIEMFNTD